MKIAICGAGTVGSYLYRLLSRAGFENITVFDKPEPPNTGCGINPCAWGTSVGFEELIGETGLDAKDYILRTFDKMVMNRMELEAEAMVIDKPRLVADLLRGVEVQRSPVSVREHDRIIDATGSRRAFLPPTGKDMISACVQYRVSSREKREISVEVSNLGYAWCFPMSGDEYHIGAGSAKVSPRWMLEKLGWLENSSKICGCAGRLRIAAPHFCLPFVTAANGNGAVWGVGEAIGCVAPLIGEGIIPGLRCARLLLANWEDPQAYRRAVLKEFSWMKGERKLINKLVRGGRAGLLDVWVLRKSTRRYNMSVGYRRGSVLLDSITKIWE
jgi:flavin-dependent dehydrogenase